MSTRSVQPVSRCNRRSLDTWATKRAWKISGGRQPTRPWEKNWFEQKTKGNPCCEHIRMSWHNYIIYMYVWCIKKHIFLYLHRVSFCGSLLCLISACAEMRQFHLIWDSGLNSGRPNIIKHPALKPAFLVEAYNTLCHVSMITHTHKFLFFKTALGGILWLLQKIWWQSTLHWPKCKPVV